MKVTINSIITLVPIQLRPDGGSGGMIAEADEAGEFFELPPAGAEALAAIQEGIPLERIERELCAKYPQEEIDLAQFAAQLLDMGLVKEIDGQPAWEACAGAPKKQSHGNWNVPPSIAGLIFNSGTVTAFAVLFLCNAVLLAAKPSLIPTRAGIFVFDSMLLNTLLWIGISLCLLLIHESGHYLAARAKDLPVKMGIGHRLFLLVVETDITPVWRLPSQQRNVLFLAGMCFDQAVLFTALMVRLGFPDMPAAADGILQVGVYYIFLTTAYQCLFYMKTDLYYVAENVSGVYNLMETSRAWLAGLIKKERRNHDIRNSRWAVRAYAFFYVIGLCLSAVLFFAYLLPQLLMAFFKALEHMERPSDDLYFWDGVVFLAQLAVFGGLLLYSWLRTYSAGFTKRFR